MKQFDTIFYLVFLAFICIFAWISIFVWHNLIASIGSLFVILFAIFYKEDAS
jgi:hypothetical protein